jgi:hypothetical protein
LSIRAIIVIRNAEQGGGLNRLPPMSHLIVIRLQQAVERQPHLVPSGSTMLG